MGYYLNSSKVLSMYGSEVKKPYFVDKTEILNKLIPLVEQGNNHICITRPRCFGKSVMASMIAAYFGKGIDSSGIFDSLKIAAAENYREHLNQHNVIYINFTKSADTRSCYEDFIKSIEMMAVRDLRKSFPGVDYWDGLSLPDYLGLIHEDTGEAFLLIFDEWDCVLHKDYMSDENREHFIGWLAAMTKDTGYVSLSYMTGVFPISEYSGSIMINNFVEFSMETDDLFGEYFGFTDSEVDELYLRYKERTQNRLLEREDLRYLYGGYRTPSSGRMYNPGLVVEGLTRNQIKSYWKARNGMTIENYKVVLHWSDEDDCYIAEVPELPGCMADGSSIVDVAKEVEDAIKQWIEVNKERGIEIPQPRGGFICT